MFLDSFAGANFEDESDFFPLLSSVDEEKINKEQVPKSLAILPLRNTVLFPGVIIPITCSRKNFTIVTNSSTIHYTCINNTK